MTRRQPVALLLVLALLACGTSARSTAIQTTLVGVEAADKAFVAYDQIAQQEIVAKAESREAGETRLAAYRAKRSQVQKLLVAAYAAVGVASKLNDDHSVAAMMEALATVVAAVCQLTGGCK